VGFVSFVSATLGHLLLTEVAPSEGTARANQDAFLPVKAALVSLLFTGSRLSSAEVGFVVPQLTLPVSADHQRVLPSGNLREPESPVDEGSGLSTINWRHPKRFIDVRGLIVVDGWVC
jgi:hypothetical protein